MTVSKLNPWNWFKKEDEHNTALPVKQSEREAQRFASPLDQFHADFDRMVDSMFSDFGLSPARHMLGRSGNLFEKTAIKPKVDVFGTETEYVIEADMPGVEEDNLSIELKHDVLILSAEKKHEEKTEDKGYYRVERSHGSFRRVFNIPEDADKDNISAKLTNGVLRITMPRTGVVESNSRRIPIEHSSAQTLT